MAFPALDFRIQECLMAFLEEIWTAENESYAVMRTKWSYEVRLNRPRQPNEVILDYHRHATPEHRQLRKLTYAT